MRIHASLELPSQTNPADWIIDIVDAEQLPLDLVPHVAGTPVVLATDGAPSSNLADVWKSSGASAQAAAAAAKAVAEVLAVSTGSEATATSGRQPQFATSLPWQFQVLLSRATRQQRGDVFNTVNVFQIVAVAVIAAMIWSGSTAVQDIIGVLFFVNIQQSFNAQNTVLRLFPSERALMQRERRSDTYHMLPYFLAKSLGDLVAVFVLPILYALIIYFAVGLRIDTAAPFFWYLLLSLTTVFTGQSLGLLVSLAVPDLALANCVSFVFVLFIMLFGGSMSMWTESRVGLAGFVTLRTCIGHSPAWSSMSSAGGRCRAGARATLLTTAAALSMAIASWRSWATRMVPLPARSDSCLRCRCSSGSRPTSVYGFS